jgi:cGMP-dependent protein kinase
MKIQYKKANELVFKKGTTVLKLLIVMEGKLKKFRSANYLAEAGQIWGEIFLNETINNRLEDDIIV